MRVCVVITARASYARIKTALEAIQAHPELELQVVTAGSALLERYGNVADVMEAEGFPSERVLSVVEGGTPEAMVKGTGLLMAELGGVFARTKPDAVVTIADRHETLATAVAASYQNIPLVHVQGGEDTGSIDDRVRRAVTMLADHHLVATRLAGSEVAGMIGADRRSDIPVVGCPSIDLARRAEPLERLTGGTGAEIDLSRPFLIVMQHPVTTEYHLAEWQAWQTIWAIWESGLPAIWIWPNVDAGTDGTSKALRRWRESHTESPGDRVHFVRNLAPEHFAGLAKRAACIVGNSSFGIREASYLSLPAVNIGTRQQGRERAYNVTDVDHDPEQIAAAILKVAGTKPPKSYLYGDGKAGERIAKYLAQELGRKREAA